MGGGRDARGRRLVTLVRVRRRGHGELRVHRAPGSVLATGSMLAGALALLPFAVADPPTHAPGTTALAALLALALLPTFVGQLLLFRMLRLYGSPRLSLVTYLMPGSRSSTASCSWANRSRPRRSGGSR